MSAPLLKRFYRHISGSPESSQLNGPCKLWVPPPDSSTKKTLRTLKICPQNYISSPSHLIGEPIEGVDSYAQTWRELLATQHGASVTVTDAYDNTALQSEPKVDSINCVRLIVQHRILMDAVNYPNKLPLMNAMFFQHIDVVRYLIWKDASTTPELCCDSGSALTLASYTACS
uniref:Ank_2 domain containing protein n=1 Tax=Echinococcus granulosus TaxID=6210 RepID=A0A068WZ52_ECHGR|nr:Ank_2 domain containing protein [Echinococcus granulosus]